MKYTAAAILSVWQYEEDGWNLSGLQFTDNMFGTLKNVAITPKSVREGTE